MVYYSKEEKEENNKLFKFVHYYTVLTRKITRRIQSEKRNSWNSGFLIH